MYAFPYVFFYLYKRTLRFCATFFFVYIYNIFTHIHKYIAKKNPTTFSYTKRSKRYDIIDESRMRNVILQICKIYCIEMNRIINAERKKFNGI